MGTVEKIVELFEKHGDSEYGGEAVTQLEHALQAALLAEQEKAPASLIAAALLHDVGHLLHDLPNDAPDQGIDDHHENSAGHFLRKWFPASVAEPVRLHVAAKRYLCATDPTYMARLSEPSLISLKLQGGPMTDSEIAEFEANPFFKDAVRLRHWDDTAKDPELSTPPFNHFVGYLRETVLDS